MEMSNSIPNKIFNRFPISGWVYDAVDPSLVRLRWKLNDGSNVYSPPMSKEAGNGWLRARYAKVAISYVDHQWELHSFGPAENERTSE